MDELYRFLEQSNISRKNIARLEILAQHASSEVKDLALLILEVARVKPHKRRRWRFLAQNHSELFLRLKALSEGDIPDADLSALDLDILPMQHLESGAPTFPLRSTRESGIESGIGIGNRNRERNRE